MTKTLIITEKPSVARDIARVLNIRTKGEGFFSNEKYIISWAIGHLLTLCEPEDYNPALKKWAVRDLPILPEKIRTKPIFKTQGQLRILVRLLRSQEVSEIVCATDSGREGELIFRYIYAHAGCRKPVRRLWISSMTDAAISAGFANLRPMADFDNLYNSALVRSHSDWLVGINASRAYSLAQNANLPVGRVQTPTLAMIVARQAEIDNFVAEDYWEVHANFLAENGEYSGKYLARLNEKEAAHEIVRQIKGKTGQITALETKENRQPPPLLHDLADLQREANKKFGFSASKTLSVAQGLYERHKVITYPRTDSRHLTSDIKLQPIIANLANQANYAPYAEPIRNLETLPLNKRIIDPDKVSDHHAIIPTEKRPPGLNSDEFKVYDLIARRFLAAFYPAFVQNMTRVATEVSGHKFLSKGAILVDLGWKVLYKGDKENDKENQVLPDLKLGEDAKVAKAATKAKKTQPPKPYTEATLLSAMERCALGTAATRAAMIERLLAVEYIIRKGKALAPTDKGKMLIGILPPEITSAETTGRWERGLQSISKGNMQPARFMESIHRFVHYLVNEAVVPHRPPLRA
ncbi:MAG: DNA topoisomerase 3 [Clostridiales bacterium]|jgi:DNA topoisomerase-3|nr:DNA topoisomerase 3 [Clostridiales bacterium]